MRRSASSCRRSWWATKPAQRRRAVDNAQAKKRGGQDRSLLASPSSDLRSIFGRSSVDLLSISTGASLLRDDHCERAAVVLALVVVHAEEEPAAGRHAERLALAAAREPFALFGDLAHYR